MYTNSILLYVNKAYLCILVRCGRVRYMILIYEKLEHVGPCERIHLNLHFMNIHVVSPNRMIFIFKSSNGPVL